MGACASRPKDLDGDVPTDLPVAQETPVVTPSEVTPSEVTPAEASATTEAAVEVSETSEEKKEEAEEEALLVDLSSPKVEEAKEVANAKFKEEKVTPKETEGERTKEATATTDAMESEEDTAKAVEEKPTEENKIVEAQSTQA